MQGPQQQPNQQGDTPYGGYATIMRQLERLDERTRDLATRSDLESLRKEVVARDLLEPQLSLLKSQIARLEADRLNDRREIEKRIDTLENETISRSERLWTRLGPAIAALAFVLSLFEFLTHVKLVVP